MHHGPALRRWSWRLGSGRRIAAALASAVVVVAAAGAVARRAPDRCAEAVKAADHRSAAAACQETFSRTGDARAGAAAGRAHLVLGHDDEVLALVERLRDGPYRALALQLAGVVHDRRGETERARAELREALSLHQAAGEHGHAARDAHALAGSYWRDSQYRAALDHLQVASAEATAAGDRRLRGYALMGLASVFEGVGDAVAAQRALAAADDDLRADAEAAGVPRDDDRGYVRLKEGILYDALELHAAARAAFDDALTLGTRAHRSDVILAAELWLAYRDRVEGHLDRADARLTRTRRELLSGAGGADVSMQLYNEAGVARARGRLDEAERALAEAAGAGPDPDDAWQIALERGEIAEARGDLDAAEAHYEGAIDVIEGMREELQINELKSWLLSAKRQPYEALFALEARRGRPLEAFAAMELAGARTFIDAFIAGARAPREREPPISEAVEAAKVRADVLSTFLPPLSRSAVVAGSPAREILAAVAREHVLVYFAASGRLWLVVVAGGEPTVIALEPSLRDVERLVDRFLADPDDASLAAALGRALLPRGALPPPSTPLYVVPGGPLTRLPFAALRVDGRFLVEDHALAHPPSVTALARILAQPPGAPGPPLVLGDPRGDLPGAAEEASRVAELLGVRALTGQEATLDRLRAGASASVLHIGAHAGISPRGAWLALADGDIDVPTILAWRLRPRLSVLASCASGATSGGETWGALSAAFLAAGTPTVLATLRSVDDSASAALIALFYQHGGAHDAAEALASAQRILLDAVPVSVWASFAVFGSMRPGGDTD